MTRQGDEDKTCWEKLVGVSMTFEDQDGVRRTKTLKGEDAAQWLEKVNGAVTMAAIHGYELPQFPWTRKEGEG